MRTQLIESVVVGTMIGGIVLFARWLVPDQALIQLGMLLIGAILLIVFQRFLVRADPTQPPIQTTPVVAEQPAPEPPAPIPPPPTMLHSPRLEWADSADSNQLDMEGVTPPDRAKGVESEPKDDDSTEKVV